MVSGRSTVTAATLGGRAGPLAATCLGRLGRSSAVAEGGQGLSSVVGWRPCRAPRPAVRGAPLPLSWRPANPHCCVQNAGAPRPSGWLCCSFPTCPPLAGDARSLCLHATISACWPSNAWAGVAFESRTRSTRLLSEEQKELSPPRAGTELSKHKPSFSPGKTKCNSFSSVRSSPASALHKAPSAAAGWDGIGFVWLCYSLSSPASVIYMPLYDSDKNLLSDN